jgi:hypothetical protein
LPADLEDIAGDMERRYRQAAGVALGPDDSTDRAALEAGAAAEASP